MHNPFRRAARNGAPDMRVTAPPSAETPMPAPWLLYPPDNTMIVVGDVTDAVDPFTIGMAFTIDTGFEQAQVNARKMVAAPDMLAALERIVAGFEAMYDTFEQSGLYDGRPTEIDGGPISQVRAAIAKAKGETE